MGLLFYPVGYVLVSRIEDEFTKVVNEAIGDRSEDPLSSLEQVQTDMADIFENSMFGDGNGGNGGNGGNTPNFMDGLDEFSSLRDQFADGDLESIFGDEEDFLDGFGPGNGGGGPGNGGGGPGNGEGNDVPFFNNIQSGEGGGFPGSDIGGFQGSDGGEFQGSDGEGFPGFNFEGMLGDFGQLTGPPNERRKRSVKSLMEQTGFRLKRAQKALVAVWKQRTRVSRKKRAAEHFSRE